MNRQTSAMFRHVPSSADGEFPPFRHPLYKGWRLAEPRPRARKRKGNEDVLECCTWSLNLEGLLECLRQDGIRRVWVELQDRAELPEDYCGPTRLKVVAVLRAPDCIPWATAKT